MATKLFSPFLEGEFVQKNPESTLESNATNVFVTEASSPFLNLFERPGQDDTVSPEQEAFVSIVDELYDEELEEALEDMAHEAATWYQERSASIAGGRPVSPELSQQFMTERFSPFLQEIEQLLDHSVQLGNQFDRDQINLQTLIVELDRYQPLYQFEGPHFEYSLWSKIKNTAKKVAKKTVTLAKKGASVLKKLGLGPILNKLKGYAMSFLKGFLQKAMNKIPASLRPYAEKLQAKYLGKATGSNELQMMSAPPLQQELNMALAEMLLSDNPAKQDADLEGFMHESSATEPEESEAIIRQARTRLLDSLENLEAGESPEPAVEEFVSAVLTGLRWGIRVIGKKRVKDFLVNQLTKITAKLVDQKNARQLSKLMVDQGFSMLNLEMAKQNQTALVHEAVVATLEDTLTKVGQLPESVMDNEQLFEGFLMEAFEQSAKANLPDMLSEQAYRENPSLRDSNRNKFFWINRFNKQRQRQLYKKLNQELEADLSPYVMQEIKTHGGIPLASFLRDSLGVNTGDNVPVRVKLFEVMPGGSLADVIRQESFGRRNLPSSVLLRQFHPLTSVAAGLLLGEPSLGCQKKSNCLSGDKRNAKGHRFYYLDIAQAQPQIFTRQDGTPALRRPSQVRLKFNFIQRQIEVLLFFSETDAQNITVNLRKGWVSKAFHQAISLSQTGLSNAMKYPENGQCAVLHPMVLPGPGSGSAIHRIPKVMQQAVVGRLAEWISAELTAFLNNNAERFAEATANEADGISIRLLLAAPEMLDVLYDFISGKDSTRTSQIFPKGQQASSISLQSDYAYE